MMNALVSGDVWARLLHAFSNHWVMIGLVGQLLFGMRFLLQWVESERRKRSVIPKSFWYLSLAGSAILLVYAIHIEDPVFIIANSFNGLIYTRNLMLIRRTGLAERDR